MRLHICCAHAAGAEDTDSLGRKQKQLRLTTGTEQPCSAASLFPAAASTQRIVLCTAGSSVGQLVRVRKLAAHSGKAFGKDASKGKGHARRRRV